MDHPSENQIQNGRNTNRSPSRISSKQKHSVNYSATVTVVKSYCDDCVHRKMIKSSGKSTKPCKTATMVLNQSEISPLTLTVLKCVFIHILQYPNYLFKITIMSQDLPYSLAPHTIKSIPKVDVAEV